MTEEMIKETKKEECNCFCKSEGFRNFIVVATGTFVGVFCAISLFAALHKPPKFIPMQPRMMQPYAIQNIHGCPIQDMQRYHNDWRGVKPHPRFEGRRQYKDFDCPRFKDNFEGKKQPPRFEGKNFDKKRIERIKHKRAIEKKIENKTTDQ